MVHFPNIPFSTSPPDPFSRPNCLLLQQYQMGNCIGSSKAAKPHIFIQSNGNAVQGITAEAVAFSLKQFETDVTNDIRACDGRGQGRREKAVIIETSSELVAGDQEEEAREEVFSEHTIKLNPTQSILVDSYEDLVGSLRYTANGRLLDIDATLLGKLQGQNVDSRIHCMKLTNDSGIVNTWPSGEFYQAMSGRGIVRRR